MPAGKGKSTRCGGAERHGARWRVREFDGTGASEDLYFAGPEGKVDGNVVYAGPDPENAARDYVVAFRTEIGRGIRGVGDTLEEYLAHLAKFGGTRRRGPLRSLGTRRSSLEGILRTVSPGVRIGNRGRRRIPKARGMAEYDGFSRALSTITPKEAQKLYAARVTEIATDSHRCELTNVRAMFSWCLERGYIRSNPWMDVLPEGELSAGKVPLTCDEARRFFAACMSPPADVTPVQGIAAATCLILGVRANEALDRTVRELDDNGRVLMICKRLPDESANDEGAWVKSKSSARRVKLPPVLRVQLAALAEGQAPPAYLFGSMTNGTLLKAVTKLCAAANVPRICTHALRTTHLDLTHEMDGEIAAAAIHAGHSGSGVTKRHYIGKGTAISSRAAMMEALMLETSSDLSALAELQAAEEEAAAATARLEALRARANGVTPSGYSAENPIPSGGKSRLNHLKSIP